MADASITTQIGGIVLALVTGGAATAAITGWLRRKNTEAEAVKTEAEAEGLNTDARIRYENSVLQASKQLMADLYAEIKRLQDKGLHQENAITAADKTIDTYCDEIKKLRWESAEKIMVLERELSARQTEITNLQAKIANMDREIAACRAKIQE